ncbi:uncharacterized protein CLUP02_13301 [Colletotrichum lupini]|uniref:Uncharacterized protein n=1 Tax=Colletotrichum lupini TaxID=145971 RepID=A0A9Q8T3U6_9PEZI|nr:uncharacterized protein CLUP02_13301 [Colletotrichum lupini]UQC87782.1 hypothetical protein CLUP02_13301 [Colletotrichum lupini]
MVTPTNGRVRTYHVVPRFDLAAEGGQLGFRETRASIREGSFDAWVKILGCLGTESTGGSATIAESRDAENTVSCEEIVTTYFDPDDSFLEASFAIEPVRHHLERSRDWTATLYMVTGIKVAKGLEYNRSNNIQGQIGTQAAIDGAHNVVAETSIAANFSGANDHSLEFAVASDIVIGFRVNKFRCVRRFGFGKKDRKVKDNGLLTGAMMANDNDNVPQEHIKVEALAISEENEDSTILTTAGDQAERCVVPDTLKQLAGLL